MKERVGIMGIALLVLAMASLIQGAMIGRMKRSLTNAWEAIAEMQIEQNARARASRIGPGMEFESFDEWQTWMDMKGLGELSRMSNVTIYAVVEKR